VRTINYKLTIGAKFPQYVQKRFKIYPLDFFSTLWYSVLSTQEYGVLKEEG
jgi:hypothetical protein